jgi:hypothetical protein
MTRADEDDEPDIPDAVRPLWDELTTEAIPARQRALSELGRQNSRCRLLVVALLRAGIRRESLVGRPWQNSRLTQIQREEGLTRLREQAP